MRCAFMVSQQRDAAIVGIYEYPRRKAPGVTALQIKAECAARALEDAGRVQSNGTPKVYIPAEVQNLGANEVHAPDALAPAPSDHSNG